MTRLVWCLLCQREDLSFVPVTLVESWLQNPLFCNCSVEAGGADRKSLSSLSNQATWMNLCSVRDSVS